MKRKIGIFALVFVLIMSLFAITVFAEDEASQLPYTQTESSDEYESVDEFYDDMFGEEGDTVLGAVFCMIICFILFIPLIVTMIVLLVLNSKTKKTLREYKFIYGEISDIPRYPQNNYGYAPQQSIPYQPAQPFAQSVQPNQPVAQPNVLPDVSPMGVNPSSVVPQGNDNIQQGGQTE
jgi:hypothetical protein